MIPMPKSTRELIAWLRSTGKRNGHVWLTSAEIDYLTALLDAEERHGPEAQLALELDSQRRHTGGRGYT